ncbi:phosphatase 2C-like domain-containing protein [Powellomyces hirtus]|nr:phosphatase 2C-like domain-containing protein [Powellomyces hirtus]
MLESIQKGVSRAQGARPYQEDHYALADEAFNKSGFALYCVFDGHGGGDASKHASMNVPKLVVNSDAFKKGDYERSLRDAFQEEDHLLAAEFKGQSRGGSTATVVLIAQQTMFIANVGDSTAALAIKDESGRYKALRLSKEHKVDDAAEAARLKDADAVVKKDRVIGPGHAINMTRALGDFDFKLPENGASADWISPVPFMSKIDLTPQADFAIIASDGLWNHFTEEQLVPMIGELLLKGDTPQQICENFTTKLGKTPGSDNITFMLLHFTWGKDGQNGTKE